ncbi:MAG: CotH kinase family protein, partial [Phycisphaerales bacterium]|nr:CotH kinase family protein [Phycisphaerales bacterium]
LDIHETIRFLAIDNAFLDSDGYYSRGSDYYIYKAPDGAFHLLHYDNNETFGGGHGGGPGGRGGPGGPNGGPPDFGPGGPGGGPPNFGPGGPGGGPPNFGPGGPGGGPPNFGPGGPGGGGGGGSGGSGAGGSGGGGGGGGGAGAGGGGGGGAGGGGGGGGGAGAGNGGSGAGGPGGRPNFAPASPQTPRAQQRPRRTQDGRRGNRRGRGGRGGPGGGQGGGMTQSPLAFEKDIDTRPLITRILAVEAWREEYLDVLRELAIVELDWAILGARVDRYRELIERDVVRDPFLGDRKKFIMSLYGSEASLKSIAAERRKFLLNHDTLKQAEPESRSDSAKSTGT